MPRFLVPVDFSTISVNAAIYAVQMAESMPRKEVILYNVTEEVHAGSDGTPIEFDGDAFLATNLRSLESLQVNLFEMGLSPMDIVAEIGELPEKIKPVINKYEVDMVVMGIAGDTDFDAGFMGSNALEIAAENTCPVMVVPPDAVFKGSSKIALAVELKDVEKTVALGPIKKWLNVLQPELHFVYFGAGSEGALTEEQKVEMGKLERMFTDYKSEFHFLTGKNFSNAINHFVDVNNIDQIVVFPKPHTVFENMFAAHHTKKLAYHSHIPVLAIHN
jgi:nucleotide-binding universal stress UspA family protein